MDQFTPYSALLGGVLIGLSATLLFAAYGRIAGISGIFGSLVEGKTQAQETRWRLSFVAGLLLAGLVLYQLMPQSFGASPRTQAYALPVAGLLVGFGTRLGSGCTSGHGVCGLSRFSPRSMVATMSFMLGGAITVLLLRVLGGGAP